VKTLIVSIGLLLLGQLTGFGQGYIVPNGVITNLFPDEIDVWNSTGISQGFTNMTQITGFSLTAVGKQSPTIYSNVFSFSEPVTIGVRTFLVASNDAISLQPILAGSWTELGDGSDYVFNNGSPFYLAFYTGSNFAPPYPPNPPYQYLNPVFGWGEFVNNKGTIQLVNYGVEYGGAGIYAGTLNIIATPEPSALALTALGSLFFLRRRK
jgi:hypothetical protein